MPMRFGMREPTNREYRIFCVHAGCDRAASREIEDGRGYRAIFCTPHATQHHAEHMREYKQYQTLAFIADAAATPSPRAAGGDDRDE